MRAKRQGRVRGKNVEHWAADGASLGSITHHRMFNVEILEEDAGEWHEVKSKKEKKNDNK